ncbi:hypothetical protein [Vagococcus fluvialis]|uniref:hypothetical protein n=1 Tax=Vagococcus fluvialis TaxID=2738 RepID=UPI0022DFA340|nr:hypothetical protein [Vagococcus fluvialis]
MEQLLIKLITSIVVTGTVGYFSYYLLNTHDLLRFSSNKKSEKNAIVSFLTLVNMVILLTVNSALSLILNNNKLVLFFSVIISIILSFYLSLNLLPTLLKSFFDMVNERRLKDGKRTFTNKSVRDMLLDTSDDVYAFIFSIDGKYIAEGTIYLHQYDTDEYYEIALKTPDKEPIRSIEKVEELFVKWNREDTRILIDFEKGIKYYLCPIISEKAA